MSLQRIELPGGGVRVDGPGVSCAFDTWSCTLHSRGAGGFDLHHRWPKFLGGPEHQDDLLTLCPTHHYRQHALVRLYVESRELSRATPRPASWYSPLERSTASYALLQWIAAGAPEPAGWSTPAAVAA